MAPIQKKRTSARAKASALAKSSRPAKLPLSVPSSETTETTETALFPSSKKDKRSIKHTTFVSKIEKSSSKTNKRRRPNKQLAANLESLADALPDLDEDEGKNLVVIGQAKIQRKSLKSRPGAMKRKEKLEKMERDRYNKNLVQMAGSSAGAGSGQSTTSLADRWSALKNHVQNTAEKKAEFIKT
ncbi:hypothetical protein K469DRAFT_690667 [Zopfia rhizophila CBS 207.26]|uniref:Ribosome biogenesis protein SLX9 n=1 Tax=Zopfia rhizophila CBS 207.26 TaxID=1314779 RepID=A0A6A6DWC3_9PEZI|nr:hypothetical protein K469DRAFT_690667 [Zopfia rhizophila CBS 207.26]